ncbi:acyl-CoA dehydrogenase family protein [Nocardioides sp. CN2-186]|uniref:acyl-CoA dehydrogenase family protein n=1 Tax=Nocardioides tweenelious TaxID=3156607 RepID=UPI0032B4C0EB
MDFQFTQEQDEAAELAAGILKDRTTNDRLKAVEAEGDRFDRSLWAELGSAGLLGLALPEEYDGAGLGIIELCRVLVEVGRTVAPVPLAAHGPASRLVAELGTDAQKQQWLPGAATGTTVMTAAVAEERAFAPTRPTTVATPEGDGYRLTGSKAIVPAGPYADVFLVPAETPTGVGVFLVEPGDAGVGVLAQTFSDRDAVARLDLDGVVVSADRLVGATDGSADHRLRQLLVLAGTAEQLGITEGALALTSTYAKTREQFGRPIGTFQAVSQRLADGYIDVLGQRLTLWQAAWRLEEGLPSDSEVAIAKLWAADAGHRLAHTTVHVHGGVGIDLDGEAHRYFTSAKRFEFLHGGSTEQALNIGRILAADPA